MREFLSEEERVSLRSQHRLARDRRVADRIKAVLLYDQGWTYQKIGSVLLLDEETISQHVEDYREKQKLKPENGGSQSKLTVAQSEELLRHLDETLYQTALEICAYVDRQYGVSYTRSGMTAWLHANGFSYKFPKGMPAKADAEKQAEFIKAYEDLLDTTPENEPIEFGDGVHPSMATKVSYGWIRRGQNKPISTTASRTRMNLFGSLNLETMSVLVGEYESINSASMADHFKKMREKYQKAPKIHLILDQGPYNKSSETQESARKYGIQIHYLPPYSPNLNPIERLWKVMNERVRNNVFFESAAHFKASIRHFFAKTWPDIATSMVDRINDNFQRVC
ncbi:MAG: IS630 family transposase [Cytophagales bacterium]|nr:IS630 family transposase [Cytophagales bacterium]